LFAKARIEIVTWTGEGIWQIERHVSARLLANYSPVKDHLTAAVTGTVDANCHRRKCGRVADSDIDRHPRGIGDGCQGGTGRAETYLALTVVSDAPIERVDHELGSVAADSDVLCHVSPRVAANIPISQD
jgi:hypothetical protein